MPDRDTVNNKGLLPCPLCGGEVTLWNYEFGTIKVFECKACRTRFIFPWDKDVSEWNHRVSEKSAESQRNEYERDDEYWAEEAMFDSFWGGMDQS